MRFLPPGRSVLLAAVLGFAPLGTAAYPDEGPDRRSQPLAASMAETLIYLRNTQRLLSLDPNQYRRLNALAMIDPAARAPLTVPEIQASLEAARRVAGDLPKLLRPDQQRRLRQIVVRRLAHFAPLHREIAAELRLDRSQREAVRQDFERTKRRMDVEVFAPRRLPAEQRSDNGASVVSENGYRYTRREYAKLLAIRRACLRATLARLRPDQRHRWESMIGAPYADSLVGTAPTLEAQLESKIGGEGDGVALRQARLRMLGPEKRARFRRQTLREAGPAGLLFPEVAKPLGIPRATLEKIYDALLDDFLAERRPRVGAEAYLDARQRRVWEQMVAL